MSKHVIKSISLLLQHAIYMKYTVLGIVCFGGGEFAKIWLC